MWFRVRIWYYYWGRDWDRNGLWVRPRSTPTQQEHSGPFITGWNSPRSQTANVTCHKWRKWP